MTNVLIFGKDPFRVDIIGTWMAGTSLVTSIISYREERGLSSVVEPAEVPVYLWGDSGPEKVSLNDIERFQMRHIIFREIITDRRNPVIIW